MSWDPFETSFGNGVVEILGDLVGEPVGYSASIEVKEEFAGATWRYDEAVDKPWIKESENPVHDGDILMLVRRGTPCFGDKLFVCVRRNKSGQWVSKGHVTATYLTHRIYITSPKMLTQLGRALAEAKAQAISMDQILRSNA